MSKETKQEAFERLAALRCTNATHAITLMHNLARPNRYESTPTRRREIVGEIEAALEALKVAWDIDAAKGARIREEIEAPVDVEISVSSALEGQVARLRDLPISNLIDLMAAAGAIIAERRK